VRRSIAIRGAAILPIAGAPRGRSHSLRKASSIMLSVMLAILLDLRMSR
jgi:hypothetical protein